MFSKVLFYLGVQRVTTSLRWSPSTCSKIGYSNQRSQQGRLHRDGKVQRKGENVKERHSLQRSTWMRWAAVIGKLGFHRFIETFYVAASALSANNTTHAIFRERCRDSSNMPWSLRGCKGTSIKSGTAADNKTIVREG